LRDAFASAGGVEADWSMVRKLIQRQEFIEVMYCGHKFYLRKLNEWI
jgi:hypothetical protein